MVLQGKPCGRVGRRRNYGSPVSKETGRSSFSCGLLPHGFARLELQMCSLLRTLGEMAMITPALPEASSAEHFLQLVHQGTELEGFLEECGGAGSFEGVVLVVART